MVADKTGILVVKAVREGIAVTPSDELGTG